MTTYRTFRSHYNALSTAQKRIATKPEIIALCEAWQNTGDAQALNAIITNNAQKLIKSYNHIAKKYGLSDDEKDELFMRLHAQIIETANKFDTKSGNAFSSYLFPRLDGTALDFVKEIYNLQSTSEKYLFFNLNRLKTDLRESNPTLSKEAIEQKIIDHVHETQKLVITKADIHDMDMRIAAIAQNTQHTALNEEIDYADEATLEASILREEEQERAESFVQLARKNLDNNSWYIVENMIMSDEPKDAKTIAQELHISQDQVLHLKEEAQSRLRYLYQSYDNLYTQTESRAFAIPEHLRTPATPDIFDYTQHILKAAVTHNLHHGQWPNRLSGDIKTGELRGSNWEKINADFKRGKLEHESDAKSLSEFLKPYKDMDIHHLAQLCQITPDEMPEVEYDIHHTQAEF